jgi:hypothetical protein
MFYLKIFGHPEDANQIPLSWSPWVVCIDVGTEILAYSFLFSSSAPTVVFEYHAFAVSFLFVFSILYCQNYKRKLFVLCVFFEDIWSCQNSPAVIFIVIPWLMLLRHRRRLISFAQNSANGAFVFVSTNNNAAYTSLFVFGMPLALAMLGLPAVCISPSVRFQIKLRIAKIVLGRHVVEEIMRIIKWLSVYKSYEVVRIYSAVA